jgi:pimeloyl-ACP methyl ester carboxylesterase
MSSWITFGSPWATRFGVARVPPLSREDVKRIKAPVLMIGGGQTMNILKFVDSELEPLLANGKRLVIPNATHDMWNEQPEVCRQAVLGFLSRN